MAALLEIDNRRVGAFGAIGFVEQHVHISQSAPVGDVEGSGSFKASTPEKLDGFVGSPHEIHLPL